MGSAATLSVGFTTYTGHVTAARDWDEPAERRWVRPAPAGEDVATRPEVRLT